MKPLAGHTILVAEDERAVRMLLRVVLEAAGATVLEAENGIQALRIYELYAGRVDLVVSDLNMPALDGAGLVEELRERWASAVPIILCSALDVRSRAPELVNRVQDVLTKPFSPPELVQRAARAIAAADPARRAAV